MAKKSAHVSETPATQFLKAQGVAYTEHPYDYVDHGGTAESARQLGVDEHAVVKTLVMQDQDAKPLVILMHGDRQVSTKNLARQIGAKKVEPASPRWRSATAASSSAAPRRSVFARRCRCMSNRPCSGSSASTSMVAGAATSSASRRRC